MLIHKYDQTTKELTGSRPAQKRPNGQPITDVLNATTVEPPVLAGNRQAVWNGESWDVLEDHRKKPGVEGSGTPYWLLGDSWNTPARYMTELGPLPEGALLEAPAKTDEEIAAEELAAAKAERAAAVSKITATVDGMVFDGDEVAQERMARAITAAVATGEDMSATTTWVLADNTVAQVSMQQLAQALRAAGEQQTALWIVPYQEETVVEPTTEPETVPETPTATEEPADTEATA